MTYEQRKDLKPGDFKRACGVHPHTFETMLQVLQEHAQQKARPALRSTFAAPSNETERILANIWQELLGFEQIGIHDNFFDLGGSSLLGTQVISRLRSTFQIEVSLNSLFENPTVASLAEAIMQLQTSSEEPEILAQILAEVEELSQEQVQSQLT